MRFLNILLFILIFTSCDYFRNTDQNDTIAILNDEELKKDEIYTFMGISKTSELSKKIILEYTHNWLKNRLIFEKSELNLPEEKIAHFDKLTSEYRRMLYVKEYTEMIISKSLDTIILEKEMKDLYEKKKENFILNESVFRVQYIHIDGKSNKKIFQDFKNINPLDKDQSEIFIISHMPYFYNDSTWVTYSDLRSKFKIPKIRDVKKGIRKQKVFEIKDKKGGVFLVKFLDYVPAKLYMPFGYIKPIIKKMIINKQKQDFMKKLEQNLIKEAIEKNKLILNYDN